MAFQVTPETDVAEAAMFHGAQVTKTAGNQSITSGVLTVVAWDTVEYDTDGFWDSGNNRFVIPEGVNAVRVSACITRNTNTGTGDATLYIYKTGVAVSGHDTQISASATNKPHSVASRVIPVVAGDTIDVRYIHTLTGTPNIRPDADDRPNFFEIEVIKTPIGRPDSPTLP